MLKTQITGAKYLSPQTNQMTNLNIAIPADSKDIEFSTSDILLTKADVSDLDAKADAEVIAGLIARIEQLETKVRALEAANTPA